MILVFGGNGQLGQEIARAAALRSLPGRIHSHAELDITDAVQVTSAIAQSRASLVINAAAYTKVDLAEKNIEQARLANEIGPAVIAQACSNSHVPMLHVSTDYVFDGKKKQPYTETDDVCPVSEYGQTKAAGEKNVRSLLKSHIILRTAWLYSEFGTNFLKTILNLAKTKDELRIVADQHGAPTSAREIADAILSVWNKLKTNNDVWGTYHFTASGVTTWHGFANRIVAIQAPITGRNPLVLPIATSDYALPAKRPANSQLDCRLFARTFGVAGQNWTDNVDKTVRALVDPVNRISHVA